MCAHKIATTQVVLSYGNPAVKLVSTRTGRVKLNFQFTGGNLFFGDSIVTSTTGYPNTMPLDNYDGELWGILGGPSGSGTCYIIEIF